MHNASQIYNFNVTLTSYEDPWVVTTVNITNDFPYRGAFVWKDSIGDIDNDGINEILVATWDFSAQTHAFVYAFWWNSTTHTWNNQTVFDYTPASDHASVGWIWNGDFYGNGTRYVVYAIDNGPGDTNAYFHMLSYDDVNGYINTTSDKQVGLVVNTNYWHGFQVFDINGDGYREIISGTCSAIGTDSGKVVEAVIATNTTYERQQLTKHYGAIGVGDLDGDGYFDLLGSTYEIGDVDSRGTIFTANYTPAGGDWGKLNYYVNLSNLGNPGSGGFIVDSGDVDGDGLYEGVLLPFNGDNLEPRSAWVVNYYKDVNGYVQEAGNISILNISMEPQATDGAIELADLDGDGKLEIYLAFSRGYVAPTSVLEVHRIKVTNDTLVSDETILNYTVAGMYTGEPGGDESAWSLTSGDVDNDGIDELVVGTKYWANNHQKVIVIKRINSSTYADNVLLEFGGVNYSATNLTENMYNYTLYGIEGGNHSYRWWANNIYGNITYINYSYYYIATAASSVTAYINNSASNLFSPTILSTYLNATSNVTDALIDLMIDGTVINTGLSSIYNWTSFLVNGYYNITARINTSVNYTASISSYFLNVTTPPDIVYPQFSSIVSTSDGGVAYFNSTIVNTNGTSGITFDGVNYTAYNTTSNIFQVNISGLGTGTYNYFWWALGNGSMNQYNASSTYSYSFISSEVGLGICSASYMYPLANFTYKDAGTSVGINASVTSLAITYHTTFNSTFQNYTYSNVTGAPHLTICGSQNNQNYTITSISLHTSSSGYWPNTYIWSGTWYPNANATIIDNFFGNVSSSFFIEGLVNYWHFDEAIYTGAAGEVKDVMGNNNGTTYGNTSINESGYYYNAAKFDGSTEGSGSYINMTSPPSITGNITISVWVKETSYVTSSAIIDTNYSKSYLFYYYTGGKFRFYMNDTLGLFHRYVESTGAIPLNEWSNIVAMWNGTNCTLYINGVYNAIGSCNSSAAVPNYMYIGKYGGSALPLPNSSINGSIDELMIFNRTLSAAEIKSIYNSSVYNLYKADTNLVQTNNYTMWLAQNASTQTNVFNCTDNQCTNITGLSNGSTILETPIYFTLLGGTTALITFQVQNQGGGALSGTTVSVERTSDNTLIGSSITDGSGAVSFVLDMTTQYRLNFTKTGYAFLSSTLTPTQPIYTIYLTSITSNISYTNVLEGINYTAGPKSGFLNTSTLYTFWFTVNSTNLNLTNYTMNIELPNGTILNTTTGTNVTGSNITLILNTSTYTKLYGKYYVVMGNTTYQIGGITIWTILDVTGGDTSVWRLITDLRGYTIDSADNYTTLFFLFFFMFIGFGLLSKFTGMELMQPGISLFVVLLLVGIFSFAGFFTIDFTPNAFVNQYGILGVAGFLCGGYILGRLRDT